MTPTRSVARSREEAAASVWRLMSEYSIAQFRRKSRMLSDSGITPGHMKALLSLEPGEAMPMGACAHEIGCDASTATWLIDRLEEKGLVERRPSSTDRRVKGVVLTEEGAAARARLREHYDEPPAALFALSDEDLETLSRLLTKLAAAAAEAETPPAEG
ncbi:MAG TPA: MarR family transcriptional regulator [Actinomycetota bacterium]|nr:MarR family transcriptional regulator [Actinomycetota bacterium]